ncbi:MAG TPA: TlyA family rRNA (cytidine-2'-O)-methyltransferase, partial [Candidatus Avimonas sp.]|nr:TlyA family rRNA (cytidine-2'-O)-methyltransferase [Candidatus Avimonas sp.]
VKPEGQIVAMVKPQFEAGRENIGKNCVVKNPKAHINVINELISFFKSTGFRLKGLTYSPVTGGEGNIEYLALLHQGMDSGSLLDIDNVVKEAHMVLK